MKSKSNYAQELILLLCISNLYLSDSALTKLTLSDLILPQDSSITDVPVQSFLTSVQNILLAISSGWANTAIFPQLVASFFVASDNLPSGEQFERFIGSNKFFDPDHVIKWTTWNQYIANDERMAFEGNIRRDHPDYQMFLYAPNGSKLYIPPNASRDYSPIIYCSPRTDELVGFDVYNDPIEGAAIRTASATGRPVSRSPFLLRGLPPDTKFRIAALPHTIFL
jgi:hypothetical protein